MQAAGCELGEVNLFKPLSNRSLGIKDPLLIELLDYLPPPVNYGVRRLTRHFEQSGTETALMWQDGACLFAGFAALMAGVPHVQLAIRGLAAQHAGGTCTGRNMEVSTGRWRRSRAFAS